MIKRHCKADDSYRTNTEQPSIMMGITDFRSGVAFISLNFRSASRVVFEMARNACPKPYELPNCGTTPSPVSCPCLACLPLACDLCIGCGEGDTNTDSRPIRRLGFDRKLPPDHPQPLAHAD